MTAILVGILVTLAFWLPGFIWLSSRAAHLRARGYHWLTDKDARWVAARISRGRWSRIPPGQDVGTIPGVSKDREFLLHILIMFAGRRIDPEFDGRATEHE